MSRFVNIMEGRGSVMMTSIQEAQEKSNLGPPWMCTQCGKQNKSQCQRCEACKHMRPDLRVQHVVQRAQQARQGGLLIGRGGGFFQRQASEHKDDLSDDEFDVYGRRRSRRKSGTEATSKAKDSSSAAADDAAARRKAALERLRTPRKARSRTRSPARGGDEADRLEERDSHLPVQAPQHSQPQVPSRPPSQFQPGLQEQERQLMLLQAEQELQEREQQQLQQQLQAQSMISEDLKDSLEKLVSRVNKMLKPEDAGALQREGSFTPAVRAISRSHSPESQRSGLFPLLGPDGGGLAGASGPSSAAATPSNPEALARHPGNSGSLRVSAVPPGAGALGPRLVPRRGELAAAGAAAPPQAPRSSDQAKLIHKAVQELYHENSQLRDEIGSPQRGRVRPEGLGQAIAAGPGSRVGSGVAGGAGGSTTGSMAASAGGGVQKGSPRTSSLAQAAPAQQGLARGMQVARGPAQGAAVLPGQGRGAPQQQQAVRRNVMSHSYGRTGSASGIAPSR
mmetsp:Transcript_24456/g.77197  ORF Transcript_24456/g.77197 Transcript_24456/m.77197 type:complete len:508 (+) Transcript_24456:73-1596(+)